MERFFNGMNSATRRHGRGGAALVVGDALLSQPCSLLALH
jgi:hypothetical protein